MSKELSRLDCNKQILKLLTRAIKDNPDLRFQQLLSIFNMDDYNKFYEESIVTLVRVETIAKQLKK